MRIDLQTQPRGHVVVRRNNVDLEVQEAQISSYYLSLFRKVFTKAVDGISSRYHSESVERVEQMENILINPEVSNDDIEAVCNLYEGEIHMENIKRNREQWFKLANLQKNENTMAIFKSMKDNPILATLLPDLASLLRIYLTLPSTSCEAERSFSYSEG